MVGFLKNIFVCSVLFSLLFMLAACEGGSGKNADNVTETTEPVEDIPMVPCKADNSDAYECGTLTDERDGQTYKTVKIGDQVWMAENLNFKTPDSYCYNNDSNNCAKYGRIYTWSAAMDSAGVYDSSGIGCGNDKSCIPSYPVRGICPEGWYLPDTVDWRILLDAVGGQAIAGKMLKSTKGWPSEWNGKKDGLKGEDAFGFSALPAGGKYYRDDFDNMGNFIAIWSSTTFGYAVIFYYNRDDVNLYDIRPYHGNHVRCLLDDGKRRQEIDKEKRRGMAEPCKTETEDNCEYGTLKDPRDGQIYKIVKIGDQWWMAENLRFMSTQSCSILTSPALSYDKEYYTSAFGNYYGDSKYGAFYMGNDNVCPDGWHLPDCAEIETLLRSVGWDYAGEEYAAKMLKSSSGWNDSEDGTSRNGLDAYGFSALPAGMRLRDEISNEGVVTHFWGVMKCSMFIGDVAFRQAYSDGSVEVCEGYSVRCVKDSLTVVKMGYSSPNLAAKVDPCKTDSTDSCEYGTLTDDRDGQTYKTVKIGNQWWMAENLNYEYIQPNPEFQSSSFCYKNDISFCDLYGRLYMWSAAMDSAGVIPGNTANGCGYGVTCSVDGTVRGVCPEGWHLPTFAEFETLFDAVGGQTVAGSALKSSSGWNVGSFGDEPLDGNGDDSYGFSALPGGFSRYDRYPGYDYILHEFLEAGDMAFFWSSTEVDDFEASVIYLYLTYFKNEYASTMRHGKSIANSVRCVKD